MKKLVSFICVFMLLVSTVAFAQPQREGYTFTELYNFNGLPNGTHRVKELPGFFVPDMPSTTLLECDVLDGTVTYYDMNIWGSFPSYNSETTALTQNKSGWCFYVKNGLMDITVGMGFNAANGKNYVIADYVPFMLVDMNGEVYSDYSVWVGANQQGGIVIPSEFEGYAYIPFSSYCINDTTGQGEAYDPSVGIITPIYSLSDGEMITFGTFYAYNSDNDVAPDVTPTHAEIPSDDPTSEPQDPTSEPQEPTEDPSDEPTEAPSEALSAVPSEDHEPKDEAGFPWIMVAVAAVVVIAGVVVSVVLISKKKKA